MLFQPFARHPAGGSTNLFLTVFPRLLGIRLKVDQHLASLLTKEANKLFSLSDTLTREYRNPVERCRQHASQAQHPSFVSPLPPLDLFSQVEQLSRFFHTLLCSRKSSMQSSSVTRPQTFSPYKLQNELSPPLFQTAPVLLRTVGRSFFAISSTRMSMACDILF